MAVLIAAAILVAVLLARRSSPAPAPPGPLRIGGDVAITANPTHGGCDTTFTFRATGSVAGVGRMVYRWEQSDGRTTPELAIEIDPSVGSFDLHQSWRLEGAQRVDAAMTFHVLRPTARQATAKISYSCS